MASSDDAAGRLRRNIQTSSVSRGTSTTSNIAIAGWSNTAATTIAMHTTDRFLVCRRWRTRRRDGSPHSVIESAPNGSPSRFWTFQALHHMSVLDPQDCTPSSGVERDSDGLMSFCLTIRSPRAP